MRFVLGLLLIMMSGCESQNLPPVRAAVDLHPVGCGYKWFQSGYSEYVPWPCSEDRSTLKASLLASAESRAWEIARQRCPAACPPQERKDTVVWEHPSEDGVCREDYVYFFNRIFFQCGP